MPWEDVTVEAKRAEFVMLAIQTGSNISELCRRFGISRKTGYKWLGRGQIVGEADWSNRSRRPLTSPRQSAQAIEQAVLAVRLAHPAWGGRKIAHVLARDHQQCVAPSTVTAILHRHGQIDPAASAAATPWQRFEHPVPNSLWQMDFKGHFAVGSQRCHPLTVLDDHSRYNLVLSACTNQQSGTVQALLTQAFACYGLPVRINTDNGAPWGTAGQGTLSGLGVWLIRLGIGLSYSRPYHPQTNGKDERFHRTLKAEVLARADFHSLAQVQQAFVRWRVVYNSQRPHQALAMQTPAQRYQPSIRSLPIALPPIDYAPDDLVRKVQQGGWISIHGYQVRLSKALVGQPVALRPWLETDGLYDLYFCHHLVCCVDLRHPVDAD